MKKVFFTLSFMVFMGAGTLTYGQGIDPGSVNEKVKAITIMFAEEARLDEKQILVFQREYEKVLMKYADYQQQSPTGEVSPSIISSLNTELRDVLVRVLTPAQIQYLEDRKIFLGN